MAETPANGSPSETPRDSTLVARRVLAFVISFALGAIVIALLILIVLKANPFTATIPISTVNVPLWPLATIPMGLLFLIWVDYILRTGIVVD